MHVFRSPVSSPKDVNIMIFGGLNREPQQVIGEDTNNSRKADCEVRKLFPIKVTFNINTKSLLCACELRRIYDSMAQNQGLCVQFHKHVQTSTQRDILGVEKGLGLETKVAGRRLVTFGFDFDTTSRFSSLFISGIVSLYLS